MVGGDGTGQMVQSQEYNKTAIREGAIRASKNPFDWKGKGQPPQLRVKDTFRGESNYLVRSAEQNKDVVTLKYTFNNASFDPDTEQYVAITRFAMGGGSAGLGDNGCNNGAVDCQVFTNSEQTMTRPDTTTWETVRLPIQTYSDNIAKHPYIRFRIAASYPAPIRVKSLVLVPASEVTYLTNEEVLKILDQSGQTQTVTQTPTQTQTGTTEEPDPQSVTAVQSTPDEGPTQSSQSSVFADGRGLFLPGDGLLTVNPNLTQLTLLSLGISLLGMWVGVRGGD
jgi:hypothetical protein